MRSKLITAIVAVAALALATILAWGAIALVSTLLAALQRLRSDLAVAIVAASATITVSVISAIIAKRLEARAAIRQELRTKKVPVYKEIISTLFRFFMAEKIGEPAMTQQELAKFFLTTTEKLTIWGSDEVVRAYRELRGSFAGSVNPVQGLLLLEGLMVAIRKDLGHSNAKFAKGTLLGLFVNDIDQVLSGALSAPRQIPGRHPRPSCHLTRR